MNSSYITSAQKATQLPKFNLPEVAFIGRSNCGKSSLLNTLLARKNLARSSSTPGRTQMVNFFSLEISSNEKMIFADLPGYGFNVASREVRKQWDQLLEAYMNRPNIKEFLYLIDARREIDQFEWDYMTFLAKKLPLVVVLTKADKLKKSQVMMRQKTLIKALQEKTIDFKAVFAVSNLKKTGVEPLKKIIFDHAKNLQSTPES